MRASAVMKMMRGNSSSSSAVAVALLAMMLTMVMITRTNCFSINKTISTVVVDSSASWCDGRNDDRSCFTGDTDLDSDEFMLDSEFSRRILQAGGNHLTDKAKVAGKPVFCDRPKPPCHGAYKNQNNPQCKSAPFKRDCGR